MGGFELAGNHYVFQSFGENLCMCYGFYGFINEDDEKILYENESLHISDCFDKLSDNFKNNYMLYTHQMKLPYKIINKNNFTLPSYWNPNMKIY